MAGRFEGSIVIARPIEPLFDFLADGENDKLFSKRVDAIERIDDGPIGVGSAWRSKVNDGGVKSDREFRLTLFERPAKIRWTEISENKLSVPEGGYDLEPAGDGATRLTLFNVLQGSGFGGGLIEKLALRQARRPKGVGAMLADIKRVAEERL